MKKVAMALTKVFLMFALIGCSNGDQSVSKPDTDGIIVGENATVLIAYFSRADENHSVGIVNKGNTQIVAEYISKQTSGTLFHIQRSTPYPTKYKECTAEAQKEKNDNARPSLYEDISIAEYDVIYLGYPIWYGDLPMTVYTFIESKDWNGKTVLPFNTHEGSGQSGTQTTLTTICKGATVKNGLAIRGSVAQSLNTDTQQTINNWLKSTKN